MKTEGSGSFELDWRSLKSWAITVIVMFSTFYLSNLEPVNEVISKYMSADTFQLVSLALLYFAKKFVTNYKND